MKHSHERGRSLRRALSLGAASVMVAAMLPAGVAAAQTASPEARDTDSVCPAPDGDGDFVDVAGNVHGDNIDCMAGYGIALGFVGGGYQPAEYVSRAQMASFVARFIERSTGDELPAGSAGRFVDVPATDVHAANIEALAEAGIVLGTGGSGGGAYLPQAMVTRAQMASYVRRALSYIDNGDAADQSAPPAAGDDHFSDDNGNVHEANINAVAEAGIVQGFADGTYRPNLPVRRDQMASFVIRTYDYAVDEELVPSPLDPEEPEEPEEPEAPEVTVTGTETAAPGDDITVTFTGDLDRIESATIAGACVEDGALTIEDGQATVATAADAEDGACELTVTVTFDDDSTSTETFTVTLTTPAAETGSIEGTVTDADTEAPLADVTIAGEGLPETTTGEDGTFELDDIEPGAYTLTATLEGYATGEAEIVVEADSTATADFALTAEEPAEGQDVIAFVEYGELHIGDDGENQFVLPECPDGVSDDERYDECVTFAGTFDGETFSVDPEGVYFPTMRTAVTDPVEADVEIDITSPTGAEGTVDPETGLMTVETTLDIAIDVVGLAQCTIEGVEIVASSQDPLGEDGRVTVVDDQFAVPAATGGPLCGVVGGALGLPTGEGENFLSLDLLLVDGREPPPPPLEPADPQFEFLEGGDTEVEAGEWAYADTRLWNAGEAALGEQFGIERVVLDEAGDVVPDAETEFFLPTFLGMPFNEWVGNPFANQAFVGDYDVTTEWRVRFSEPGEYTFQLNMFGMTSGDVYASIEHEVTFTEPTPTVGSITGTVTDADTEASLTGATITGEGLETATTGEDGTYTLADVAPGEYTVTATLDGYESDAVTVTVVAGEAASADFALVAEPEPLFEAGPFTMFVESGSITIGEDDPETEDDESYVIDFTECPNGEAAEGATCIRFDGTIDEDGDFTIAPDGVSFPASEQEALPGVTVQIATGVSAPITGSIDPVSGTASFDMPMQVDITIPALETSCQLVVSLDGTTADSGDVTGSALGDDGRLTVVEGLYAVGATTPIAGDGCGIVDGVVGLPSEGGLNTAVFNLLFVQD